MTDRTISVKLPVTERVNSDMSRLLNFSLRFSIKHAESCWQSDIQLNPDSHHDAVYLSPRERSLVLSLLLHFKYLYIQISFNWIRGRFPFTYGFECMANMSCVDGKFRLSVCVGICMPLALRTYCHHISILQWIQEIVNTCLLPLWWPWEGTDAYK